MFKCRIILNYFNEKKANNMLETFKNKLKVNTTNNRGKINL